MPNYNEVIRTIALEVITYMPSTGYFVVQKSDGTYKATWQTIVAALTSNITPA